MSVQEQFVQEVGLISKRHFEQKAVSMFSAIAICGKLKNGLRVEIHRDGQFFCRAEAFDVQRTHREVRAWFQCERGGVFALVLNLNFGTENPECAWKLVHFGEGKSPVFDIRLPRRRSLVSRFVRG